MIALAQTQSPPRCIAFLNSIVDRACCSLEELLKPACEIRAVVCVRSSMSLNRFLRPVESASHSKKMMITLSWLLIAISSSSAWTRRKVIPAPCTRALNRSAR